MSLIHLTPDEARFAFSCAVATLGECEHEIDELEDALDATRLRRKNLERIISDVEMAVDSGEPADVDDAAWAEVAGQVEGLVAMGVGT